MVDSRVMRALGERCPQLKSVKLAVPAGRDPLLGMDLLAGRLRALSLAYTGGARLERRAREELTALLAACTRLERLELERWPAGDESLAAAASTGRLREVRLRLCNSLTDDGLLHLLLASPDLAILQARRRRAAPRRPRRPQVDSCLALRWRWAQALEERLARKEGGGGRRALGALRAVWCGEACGLDALVASLAPRAPALRELHAAACTPVHPPTLRLLARCCPLLSHLRIPVTGEAAEEAAALALELFPRLEALALDPAPCASLARPAPGPPPPPAARLRAACLPRCGPGLLLGRLPALAFAVTTDCALADAAAAPAPGPPVALPALRALVVRECPDCAAARGQAAALDGPALLRLLSPSLAPHLATLTLSAAIRPRPSEPRAPGGGRPLAALGAAAAAARAGLEVRVLESAAAAADALFAAAFPSRSP